MAPHSYKEMDSAAARQRWTQNERRRKQPSLYDEYLNQEKQSQSSATGPVHTSVIRPVVPLSRDASETTIRTVTTPDKASSHHDRSVERPNDSHDRRGDDSPASVTPTETQLPESQLPPRFAPSLPSSPGSSSSTNKEKEKAAAAAAAAAAASPRPLARAVLNRSESTDATKRDNLSRIVGSRRPRTRTLDEHNTRDPSPGSMLPPKNRLRHGSMHNTPTHSANDSVSSIGHPQLVSPLSQTSFSSTSTAPPPRPQSPVSLGSISDSMGGPLPTANAKRILHLMKTLCGRMSGNLQFRRGAMSPWTSSYCYIQEEVGSLMCEPEQDAGHHRALVADLRGCQVKTAMDDDIQIPYLDIITPNSALELHIRLKDRSDFDSWFAALLCWHPIRPRGIQNKMAKPQSPIVAGMALADSRRNSEMSLTLKEAAIIKVGPMIYWDSNISYSNATTPRTMGRPQAPRMQSYGSHWWRKVSCTLRENGELKLYAESGSNLLSVVQLSQLSRCAIQRLDPSVLDSDFCIAIYPQYTSGSAVAAAIRPIYLSLESRMLYEVWFVLLRAFTIPQLYGPKPSASDHGHGAALPSTLDNLLANTSTDMFRMERSLAIRIVEAKLPHTRPDSNHQYTSRSTQWSSNPQQQEGHYVEILLDNESRAKTQIKYEGSSPFWREEFDYLDLPTVLTSASVLLRRRPPDLTTPREQHELRLVHEAYGLLDNGQGGNRAAGFTGISHDITIGKVEIHLEALEGAKEVEQWWPVMNGYGENAGEILIKARAEEIVILMSRDYEPLSQLLHKFDNELTLQIAQMVPTELRRLSDILLNIFQVSGKVEDWICSLVEEEIDGVHKETPVSRLRYGRRVGSEAENAAAITASSERELIVRDMNKNATLEANLLFRGNTLLTKSLDSYMRRVGKEYLTAVLGPVIKDINEKDPDCEVDPNRVNNERALERNWQRLVQSTQDIWNAIKTSAKRAPVELKIIFRHIRACAEDRYGDFLRSVSYSSVSGFLFLRFFCPAVLNPKLFGLLKDDPKPRARRTFTLIAKSLQGLANMASFGSKEHWMEPMNAFLGTHRESFKSFIDDVCYLPPAATPVPSSPKPTSYSTPIAIRNRLPLTSQEGFPSLPYLIDQAREFAGLVELWLQGTGGKDGSEGIATSIGKEDGDLLSFHTTCKQLHARTQDCLSRAERAERPHSDLSFRWEELIEQLQSSSGLGPASRPVSKQGPTIGEEDEYTGLGSAEYGVETSTRDSFDDVAMRAAGEAAARARGALARDVGRRELLEEDSRSIQDFENDRDGGAASVAASMLQQENSTVSLDRRAGIHFRGSFDMNRAGNVITGTSSMTSVSAASGSIPSIQQSSSSSTVGFLPRDPTISSQRDRAERDREITRDIESQLAGNKRTGGPSAFNTTITTIRGGSAQDSPSGSAVSSETDSNATTALPSWTKERERREKEKERMKKREKEERERRLKDFVPLAQMMGGIRGRRKDKKDEKEKEDREKLRDTKDKDYHAGD